MRVVGLISGTSADGIDAVLADIQAEGSHGRIEARVLAQQALPYDPPLRASLLDGVTTLGADGIARLHYRLGECFAQAALAVMEGPGRADLIGSHGQTVSHLPGERATLQLGEPAVIAERCGITTVANFRAADVAAGGEGAPLVPFVDFHLFGHPTETRVCLNLGGVANITFLKAGGALADVRGFDTGPGNMVIDSCVAALSGGRERHDHDGGRAARGRVDPGLLDDLLADPFFQRQPPKSCGREEFGPAFAARALRRGLSEEDVCATITALTAESIARAVRPFQPIDRVLVSGGGVHNRTLMSELRRRLPGIQIEPVDRHGYSSDLKEALAFAVLAFASAHGWPANLPACTGARHPVVLGQITPGASHMMPLIRPR